MDICVGAVRVVDRLALTQARRTDGLFDPTVLRAIVAAGYDRDFDEVLAGARARCIRLSRAALA
jgi:hypothetical protein